MDDSDGYALSPEKLGAEIRSSLGKDLEDFARAEILPGYMKLLKSFAGLLASSEGRIDRTNAMIGKLTDACRSVENAYTAHVESLQKSRDTSQQANADLVKTCDRLSRLIERKETAFRRQIEEKDRRIAELEAETKEEREQYRELQKSYFRIAEAGSVKQSGNTMEMNVNSK